MSTAFVAGVAFNGLKSVARKGYSIINNEFLRQNLLNGDIVSSLRVPKGIKFVGKFGGSAISIYGALDIEAQYSRGEITSYEGKMEQFGNGVGALPTIGSAWSIGWELGREITKTSGYQQFKADFYKSTGGYYEVPIRYRRSIMHDMLKDN